MDKKLFRATTILSAVADFAGQLNIETKHLLTDEEQFSLVKITSAIEKEKFDSDQVDEWIGELIKEYASEVIRLGLPQTENQ